MPAYGPDFAELYDVFYQEKAYDSECAFLVQELGRAGIYRGARILELACGTGQHAICLAKAGYDVLATDVSAAMVRQAEHKAKRENAGLRFAQRDMRELPLASPPFDAVLCLFDSLGYVQTNTAIASVFNGVAASLRPGGIFIFEYFHKPPMLRSFEQVRVRRFKLETAEILRISETELERDRDLAHITFSVYILRSDSTYRSFQERHTNRYFDIGELEALGRDHGFVQLSAHGGYRDTAATEVDWHIVAVWKRGTGAVA